MHDEVSDTENIRKNLAIERTIVEGCDILLDTSQTFIRQGKTFFFKAIYIILKKLQPAVFMLPPLGRSLN